MKKYDIKREWKVNGSVYTIYFRRKIKHHLRGLCHGDTKSIDIALGMDMHETLSTVVHELLHAIEFENDFHIPHHVIYKLEKPLLQFILDNYLE